MWGTILAVIVIIIIVIAAAIYFVAKYVDPKFQIAQTSSSGATTYVALDPTTGVPSLTADAASAAIFKAVPVVAGGSIARSGSRLALQDTVTGMWMGSVSKSGVGAWASGTTTSPGNTWGFAPEGSASIDASSGGLAPGAALYWFHLAGGLDAGTQWIVTSRGAGDTEGPLVFAQAPSSAPTDADKLRWTLVAPPS